ncbi:MAG: TonB-dependent receptor, partial [Candidatus Margulisbacteria bacterium]|nr:TonB-dependent receptor [Candidatus Margulisiibacteriota bacterium]
SFLFKDLEVSSLGLKLSPSLRGNYSQNKFIDFVDGSDDFSKNSIPGIPTYKANLGLEAIYRNRVYSILDYQMVGSQWLSDVNSLQYGSYELFNGKVGYKNASKNVDLYFGVNNILNEKYASMILINASGWGGKEPRYYYPGMPRNIYFGFNKKF